MRETTGDLWDFMDDGFAIVIPTNIGWRKDGSNVMGRGLARQASKRFPELAAIYGQQCKEMVDHGAVEIRFLGDLILFPVKPLNPEKPWLSWQGMADPVLIEQSAMQLADWTKHRGERLIALPLVGCGNGGLGEEVVLPILHHHLSASRFVLVRQGG